MHLILVKILRKATSVWYNSIYKIITSAHINIQGYFILSRVKVVGDGNVVNMVGDCTNVTIVIEGNNNVVNVGRGRLENSSFYLKGNGHRVEIANHRAMQNMKVQILDSSNHFTVGEDCGIGGGRIVIAGMHNRIEIGARVMIADSCELWASDTHSILDLKSGLRMNEDKPIIIENDVWLGVGVVVLKGVRIGAGSIVGMRAVVTADVPPNTISAGVPARVIKEGVGWRIERVYPRVDKLD